jgi:AcrR family transcriptional regulator
MSVPRRQDHRSRVARERRQRTRTLLIESALTVYAAHGPQGGVIDRVIETAGVSRGTFYNYFRDGEALLAALALEVSDQVLGIVDPVVRTHEDPVARIATGVRLVLAVAGAHPQLAAFMVRGGVRAIGRQGLAVDYLVRDLSAGIASGAFAGVDLRVAVDLVTGSVLAGCDTLLAAQAPRGYAGALATMLLMALGVPASRARSIALRPLPEPDIPGDSLFVRAATLAAGPPR